MSIVARFFPNGEFSHGVDTSRARKERRHKERRDEITETFLPDTRECRDRYLQWRGENPSINLCVPGQAYLNRDESQLWVYTGDDQYGNHLYDVVCANSTDVSGVQMNQPIGRLIGHGNLTPLVHQSVEFSPSAEKPPRKRLLSMTRSMMRNIRNGVYLLEQFYGKDQLSFLTLTLPGLSTDELAQCCQRWDYLVDQTLKWLRKRLQKLNIAFQYVYCTEIQSKRLQLRGEYAPHLHIVFRGRNAKKAPWAITPKEIRKAWKCSIARVIGHDSFDANACENLQRIKYSAGRYLAKYLSKGSCSITPLDTSVAAVNLRTQWGGMARNIARAIRTHTTVLCHARTYGDMALRIICNMDELLASGVIRYYKPGFIVTRICPHTGMEYGIHVGCGCLQTPTYQGGLVAVALCLERIADISH